MAKNRWWACGICGQRVKRVGTRGLDAAIREHDKANAHPFRGHITNRQTQPKQPPGRYADDGNAFQCPSCGESTPRTRDNPMPNLQHRLGCRYA